MQPEGDAIPLHAENRWAAEPYRRPVRQTQLGAAQSVGAVLRQPMPMRGHPAKTFYQPRPRHQYAGIDD